MKRTHGQSGTKFYILWNDIKQRCYNINNHQYKNYGGRGIKMCDEWRTDFKLFHDWAITHGYTEGLQIDRIDNDGNYEPNNCRWVDRFVNNNNRRNNILYTYNGVTQSLRAWCRYFNISYKTCMTRYYRGHTIEECLNLTALSDHRSTKQRYNAKLYNYNGSTYSITKLSDVLNIPRWKLIKQLQKGILPKGVTKHNG